MKQPRLLLIIVMVAATIPSALLGQVRRDRSGINSRSIQRRFANPQDPQKRQATQSLQMVPMQQGHQDQGVGGLASNTSTTQFDQEVEQHFHDKNLPGVVVLMARDGMLVYKKTMGFADVAAQEPVTANHVFRLASVSKWVGAVMALKMEQQGHINLNTRASNLIDDLPDHQTSRVIDTLTCRAGIRHYGEATSDLSPSNWGQTVYTSALETLPMMWHDPHVVPVGSYHYSTHSYILSAACLEQASGKTTPQLIRDTLSIPYGLNTLRTEDLSLNVSNRVKLYEAVNKDDFSQGNLEVERDNLTWKYLGGGLESSPMDLLRLGMKFCDHQIISSTNLERMMTNIDSAGYTIGCNSGVENGNRLLAKNGGQRGISSYIWMVPEKRMVMVVLTNRKSGGATELGKRLRRIALGTNQAGNHRPDLIVEQFERTGVPAHRNGKWEIPVRIRVKNRGLGGTSVPVVNGVRIGDNYRWTRFMQTIPPNESRTVETVVRISDPSRLQQGRTLSLVAMADAPISAADTHIDASGRELETSEGNNSRILNVTFPGGIGGINSNPRPGQDQGINPGRRGSGKRTNPQSTGKRTNPSSGKRTNPSSGKRTNPASGKRTNPGTGKRTNPSGGKRTNPSTDKRTNPSSSGRTNPTGQGKKRTSGNRTGGQRTSGNRTSGNRTNPKQTKDKAKESNRSKKKKKSSGNGSGRRK